MKKNKNELTCIILTKNEELNIRNCLESIKDIADRIIIVDSGSTDNTIQIAKEYSVDIYEHPFEHYAAQFNWALDNCNIETKWVYRIDADESISKELANEILTEIKKHNSDDINGLIMKFTVNFLGKRLKYGAARKFVNLTIFKNGKARYSDRIMGEHLILDSGRSIVLKNICDHNDFKGLDFWINKHNWYATREVIDYYQGDESTGLYKTASKSQKLRNGLYYKLPKFFRCWVYYIYIYYFRFGFLDGRVGKIYCWLQAYWYRFLVDAKIYEAEKNKKIPKNPGGLNQ